MLQVLQEKELNQDLWTELSKEEAATVIASGYFSARSSGYAKAYGTTGRTRTYGFAEVGLIDGSDRVFADGSSSDNGVWNLNRAILLTTEPSITGYSRSGSNSSATSRYDNNFD